MVPIFPTLAEHAKAIPPCAGKVVFFQECGSDAVRRRRDADLDLGRV